MGGSSYTNCLFVVVLTAKALNSPFCLSFLPPLSLSLSFLFKGDGRAVAIPTQGTSHDPAHPRASFDNTLPPSYSRRASCSYQSQTINTPLRQHSTDSQGESDSGHPPSPLSSSVSPPPVDLKSHPSRRRSNPSLRRSSPRDITSLQYENTDSGVRDMSGSVDSSYGGENMFDMESAGSFEERRGTYLDDAELATGSLETGERESHLQRHPTLPSPQPSRIRALAHRSNSTATCHPSQRAQDYIDMMHPRAGLIKQDYVMMRPVGPAQLDNVSPPRSLSPITETESRNMRAHRDNYENHPLPIEVMNEKSVIYQIPYENVEHIGGRFAMSSSKDMPSHRQSKEQVVYGVEGVSINGQSRSSSSPQTPEYVRFEGKGDEPRLTDSPSPVVIDLPS